MKLKSIFLLKYLFCFLVLISFSIPSNIQAQEKSNDIVIGKTITLKSAALNEDRNIFVYTPAGYDRTQDRYPVLYVLDGEGNFFFSTAVVNFLSRSRRMPRTIVIGIPNTRRMHDFTPSVDEETPNSGGADNFLKFMQDELIPYVDQNYRTYPFRTLCGHSLCGMFSIYTLFTKPDLFNAHIAISPYLMYDDEYVIKHAESILEKQSIFKNYLYITLGNEPPYFNSINKLNKLLKAKTEQLHWKYSKDMNEDHGSVPLKSLYEGLEFIYDGWQIPNEVTEQGIEAIKEHYSALKERYGYAVKIPEMFLNAFGYQLMAQGKNEKAIEVFKHNAELYPGSANVYDSLGEGYETNNQFELAHENYQKAVKLGKEASDPNTKIYQDHIKRVKNKVKKE